MDRTFWHKQTVEKPLFPDLLWSRPENTTQAGKLLIIGGNAHGFAAPAEAYTESGKAGVGLTRVVLPQHVKRLLPKGFSDMEFAPSTPSGSFSKLALAELLDGAQWSDGVLLAGDFGRNSETAVLLEQFLVKYSGQLTLTQDSADYFTKSPEILLKRVDTLLVLSFAQLQKLASSAHFTVTFRFEMDFLRLVDALSSFTTEHQLAVIVKHHETIFVARSGQISTTKLLTDMPIWRVRTAAHSAVWWLQNPAKPFQALSSSLL